MSGAGEIRVDRTGQLTAGVCGWPVAHSKSPIIHRFWLDALGLEGDYVRLPVRPRGAVEAFRALPALGFIGVNVTVPHKRVALKCADRIDLSAAMTEAANILLVSEDGELVAFNSDWAGFREPLERRNLRPSSAVVLGAGGAARAVVLALGQLGVDHLTIVNRTKAGADELLDLWLQDGGTALELVPGMQLPPADLVVNATSLGMVGQPALDVSLAALPPGATVYDLVYAPLETGLLADARARGLHRIDGLEMLIGQAAVAFDMFFGAEAPRERDAELRVLLEERAG